MNLKRNALKRLSILVSDKTEMEYNKNKKKNLLLEIKPG